MTLVLVSPKMQVDSVTFNNDSSHTRAPMFHGKLTSGIFHRERTKTSRARKATSTRES